MRSGQIIQHHFYAFTARRITIRKLSLAVTSHMDTASVLSSTAPELGLLETTSPYAATQDSQKSGSKAVNSVSDFGCWELADQS